MVREFKTQPCSYEGSAGTHDQRCCLFYHRESDRRRPVLVDGDDGPRYSAEPCSEQFDDRRPCSKGDACGLCHSTAELLYHPEFFRKRLCQHANKKCSRGHLCAFAHSREELLITHFSGEEESEPTEDFMAFRFKTQWCPIGGPHDWENCVYAHTYRDWRRTPLIGYSSWPCPQWAKSIATGPSELNYAERCPHGMACPWAHCPKEQLYHPQFYKTSPCTDARCKRGPLCAFTHGPRDMRVPRPYGAAQRALQGPIPWAMELLEKHQPNYWQPPRYHALEDATKHSYTGSPAHVRNHRRQQQAVSRALENGPPGTFAADKLQLPQSPQPYPQQYGQWMYCSDSQVPAMPPAMGYTDAVGPWGVPAEFMVWGPTVPALSMEPVASADRRLPGRGCVLQGAAVDYAAEAACRAPEQQESPWSSPPENNLSHHQRFLHSPKSSKYQGDGFRTPSTLGSPELSGTPTESLTPRQADPGSDDASWPQQATQGGWMSTADVRRVSSSDIPAAR